MDALARDFADQAHFLFVYTRETHPERYPEFPPFTSIEQKFDHARTMRERHGSPRTILIDELDGTVHRAYSGCPNMSWIVDHTGRVHFKANWTREPDLRKALETAVRLRMLKRDPEARVTPYYMEGISYTRSPNYRREADEAESTPAAR